MITTTTSTTTKTSTTVPTTNLTAATKNVDTLTAPAAQQFANQVIGGNDTAGLDNQVDGIAGANNTSENEIDYDDIDDDFISLSNPFGSGGQCHHNYHCRGRERCVRRNGKYICTRHFCNEDSDCSDGLLCRDQRCRRCRRCRDTLQAPVPKG